jgi:putative ABC transport system ATP-binding protein
METTSLLQGQPTTAPLIEARNVSHFFGEGDARSQVLFDNTFQIHPGQLVIMTGPSGSGKTTLLTLIGALRAGQVGHLEVLGRSLIGLDTMALTEMRRQIGFIFQMHNLFESLTALENVVMATHLTGMPLSEAQRRGTALLERLGLGHRLHHRPSALSGGQRQRVAVARALVCRPRLILADEPTAALDKVSSREVVNLLNELAKEEQCAIVMVTHDNRIVDQADRIMSMIDGRIVSDVQVRELVAICELLSKSNFFSQLNTAELSAIAEKMRPRKFIDGEALVRQGDVGEEFFLIAQGHTDVLTDQGGSTPVASLSPGQYFGERALLTGETRNATVVGRGCGLVYTLGKDEFQAALKVAPGLREQLQKLYFSR